MDREQGVIGRGQGGIAKVQVVIERRQGVIDRDKV
jgi:hypothetical protein